jgi:hypothetical protein
MYLTTIPTLVPTPEKTEAHDGQGKEIYYDSK